MPLLFMSMSIYNVLNRTGISLSNCKLKQKKPASSQISKYPFITAFPNANANAKGLVIKDLISHSFIQTDSLIWKNWFTILCPNPIERMGNCSGNGDKKA